MQPVIARWEWRTFGQSFGPAEAPLNALLPEKIQQSDETYLLSLTTDANVKVRDGLMDIKVLEQVDANGLEQWRPVVKAPFPLGADAIATVFQALGVHPPDPVPRAMELEELISRLSRTEAPARVVQVSKTRTRFHIGDCAAERTDVMADGLEVQTVAIEDEDPAKVVAAVRSMRLDGFPNTSYPRGLKQLIGLSIGGT